MSIEERKAEITELKAEVEQLRLEVYENKSLITKALHLTLLLAGQDIDDMEYTKREDYEEIVTIRYKNGYTKNVCVTADSGVALMRDVLAQIH